MTIGGWSVYQTAHRIVRQEVRAGLLEAVGLGEVGRAGPVVCGAAAALYELLLEHAPDRQGCCCSCRRPGALMGRRRRRCRIYLVSQQWLDRSRTGLLVPSLADEFGLTVTLPSTAPPERPGLIITGRTEKPGGRTKPSDRDATQPLSLADPGPDEPPTNPQSPAVSLCAFLPGGIPGVGQPVPDHGVAGACPEPSGLAVIHPAFTTRSASGRLLLLAERGVVMGLEAGR